MQDVGEADYDKGADIDTVKMEMWCLQMGFKIAIDIGVGDIVNSHGTRP
jgi:hypothetical protein